MERFEVQRKLSENYPWHTTANGNQGGLYETFAAAKKDADRFQRNTCSGIVYRVYDRQTKQVVTADPVAPVIYAVQFMSPFFSSDWFSSYTYSMLYSRDEAIEHARSAAQTSVTDMSYRVRNSVTGKVVYRIGKSRYWHLGR
jgi:hypothetical protein